MKRLLLIAAATVYLWRPGILPAVVFERDWKTPGDGLLTYDDVNEREWLDLTQSRFSFFPGATSGEKYANILAELNAGGLFSGFAVAKGSDVITFAESAGIDSSTFDFARNAAPTSTLIALMGVSEQFPTGSIFSFGVLDDFDTTRNPPRRRYGTLSVQPSSGMEGTAGVHINPSGGDLTRFSNTGVWLYRQVPEPSAWILAMLCAQNLGRFMLSKRQGDIEIKGSSK